MLPMIRRRAPRCACARANPARVLSAQFRSSPYFSVNESRPATGPPAPTRNRSPSSPDFDAPENNLVASRPLAATASGGKGGSLKLSTAATAPGASPAGETSPGRLPRVRMPVVGSLRKAQGSRNNRSRNRGVDKQTQGQPARNRSVTLNLSGVGTTLSESDIRRLHERKVGFGEEYDILRVVPHRDPATFVRVPLYTILFPSLKAAEAFRTRQAAVQRQLDALGSNARPDPCFPPGSEPIWTISDPAAYTANFLTQHLQKLYYGGSKPGQNILLTLTNRHGPRIDGRIAGRLPRTDEIRKFLENNVKIEFCTEDWGRDGGIGCRQIERETQEILDEVKPGGDLGVQKVVGEFAEMHRTDGFRKTPGGQGRWIVRCVSESEAQRVVRMLHMKTFLRGTVVRAEIM